MKFKKLLFCCSLITLNISAADVKETGELEKPRRYESVFPQDLQGINALQLFMEGNLVIKDNHVDTKYGRAHISKLAPYFRRALAIDKEKHESLPISLKVAQACKIISFEQLSFELFCAKLKERCRNVLKDQKHRDTWAEEMTNNVLAAVIWRDGKNDLIYDELTLQMLRFNDWMKQPALIKDSDGTLVKNPKKYQIQEFEKFMSDFARTYQEALEKQSEETIESDRKKADAALTEHFHFST